MRLLFLLLCLIQGLSSFANSEIDSLLFALKSADGVEKVNVWVRLGEAYRYRDNRKAETFLDSALVMADKLDFDLGKARAYLNLGANEIILGMHKEAVLHSEKALILFTALNDIKGVADANKNLGVLAYYHANYKNALHYYRSALQFFLQLEDILGQAKCYANIGLVSLTQGAHDSALVNFMHSLRYYENLNDQDGVANNYVYLAQVYQQTNDLDKALSYQMKALAIFEKIGNPLRQSNVLSDIGMTYHHQKLWSKALEYYQRAVDLQKELGNVQTMGISLGNIGAVLEEMNKPKQAQHYYHQSLKIARESGNEQIIPTILLNLAELAIQEEKYQSADEYLTESISLAHDFGHKSDLADAYHLLSELNEVQGYYQKALQYYQIARSYHDSLFTEEKSKQIADLQTRYEVEKKEHQIAAQKQEIKLLAHTKLIEKNLRIALMLASAMLLLIILFVYQRYRMKQRSALMLNAKNQEIRTMNVRISRMNKELEKRMLRAQMDPHFIFNALNSIQHLITINDNTSALKYLSKFSRLIRRVLENSVNTQVPLADELILLEHYLELERLRYNKHFAYSIKVDVSVDVYETEIPFLLIQPYVENSLVHGLKNKVNGGKLSIEIKKVNKGVLCLIEDNGVGRAEAKRSKLQSGFPSRGMSVTKQRLKTLNQGLQETTHVSIVDLSDREGRPCGTRVEIIIPQKEEEICLPQSL